MKWNRISLLSALLLIAVMGPAAAVAQDGGTVSSGTIQEDDIRAAVVRYQILKWFQHIEKDEREAKNDEDRAEAEWYDFHVVFVSINDGDPTDVLLAQLGDIQRVLKKRSEASIDFFRGARDKATDERGVIFNAGKIRPKGTNRAVVEGGYYCGSLCGSGEIFTVRRKNGAWVVVGSKLKWIS